MHKVLPCLTLTQKSVVRSTDRFAMTVTVYWDFKPKAKQKNGLHGSIIFIYNVVWSQLHLNAGSNRFGVVDKPLAL